MGGKLGLLFLLAWVVVASGTGVSLPIKAVNLGGWLVVEGWMTHLFHGVDMGYALMDGTRVTLWSARQGMFLSAVGGGGSDVAANQGEAKDWETLRLWRMKDSEDMFMIRVHDGQFVDLDNNGGLVAIQTSPGHAGEFQIVRNAGLARIKAPNGRFLQVKTGGVVTADGDATSGSWSDSDPSVFTMKITGQMDGDAQLCSFYGAEKTVSILQDHWNTFITEEDFRFISSNGLNAVRIPVAWWITKTDDTSSCHPPNYPGYQAMLDRAFQWAEKYNLGVIVDLHAAPWSQNGQSHSASRDGTVGWGDQNIDETVRVIEGLAARYAAKKSLLGIGLLNEPSEQVHIDTLKKYYKAGYNAVRNQVKRDDVYVIMEGRLAGGGDSEMADFARQFRNCVLDVHFYNLYGDMFNAGRMSAEQNIRYVTTHQADHLKSLIRANGALVFIGEWTAEWKVGGASREENQTFVDAQLDVYGQATFGWAFWTYSNPKDPYWSLKSLIKDGNITVPQN
ncbi:probable glucan 1,3-beta-glucosidase A [Hordeum vulgare subsp. vulgare]|uniref:Mannan endo-1,4-beta-mannosidase n=1 Tax=Hordeum vulgare subsp. vulgare TaxID=112509 RepID=A0A8I7B1A6_HORVV|nr:probable glucan 1,3-beta-glucosidase A [Hordeum vulgare subsp. vulgare]